MTNHNSEYTCDQCDFQATNKPILDKHIERKHTKKSLECKGIGSKKCKLNFDTYNELMDHRRDDHNSGNVNCRYFKQGSSQYMNSEKGGCWYLHPNIYIMESNSKSSGSVECKSCDKTFISICDVMTHRKQQHEEEVPTCNSIKEGKKCPRNDRCWFRHSKPQNVVTKPHVSSNEVSASESIPTQKTSAQGFWQVQPSSKPPDHMEKMMTMLTLVMTEVSELKQQIRIQK